MRGQPSGGVAWGRAVLGRHEGGVQQACSGVRARVAAVYLRCGGSVEADLQQCCAAWGLRKSKVRAA